MKIVAIIPARLGSKRLKEKMIIPLENKPLVWYTYNNTKKSKVDDVIIATDSKKIKKILEKHNCKIMLTSKKHKSGTDRIGEVAKKIFADFYINVQGDEPLIKPEIINKIVNYIKKNPDTQILTVKKLISNPDQINNPSVVKVVTDKNNNALYFSRASVPFPRDEPKKVKYFKHLGIYCYKREILLQIVKLSPTYLEKIEKLEQLRWLECGYKIKVLETNYDTISVDTKEDLEKVKKILKNEKK